MAQEHEIAVFKNPELLSDHLTSYWRSHGGDNVVLAELGGGALRFAGAAFPEATTDTIYGQFSVRGGKGRGPHFDIYSECVDEDYPWLGVYNLAGKCAVSAAAMPKELSDVYDRLYPNHNKEAHDARRHFGAIVLDSELSELYSGTIEPDVGLVLPQSKAGPYIIHNIVPNDPHQPGSFIKMVIPKQEEAVLEQLGENNFMPLDELLTSSLGNELGELEAPVPIRPPHDIDHSEASVSGSGLLD